MSEEKIKDIRQEYVPAYAKIWDMPFKIYAVEGTKLIIPVSMWDVVFFMLGVGLMVILNMFIPPITALPNGKFLVFPWILMKFMGIVELEGKQPHKYFWDLLGFMIHPKKYEHFQEAKCPDRISFKGEKIYFRTREKYDIKGEK